MDTETERDAGWIPCRRCKGTGTYSWEAGKSGPCFLCEGTGDGRIQNRTGFGPRRGGWRRNPRPTLPQDGGNGLDHTESEPADTDTDTLPPVLPQHLTAAEHLAAALAGLQQNAPIDETTIRAIIRDEFGEEGNALNDLVIRTESRIKALLDGVPRILEILIGDHHGQLPAMRHPMVEPLLQFVAQSIPVMLVGPAGSGKTTGAHQVAEALGLPFYLMAGASGPHEILGYTDAHGRYQSTPFRQAFEHGGVILWDEVDTSDPTALTVANAGLANGHMAFPDRTEPVQRHADFRLIAAANTYGHGADRVYVGRTQLDGATLDRFATLDWDYDESLERQLAGNDEWSGYVQKIRKAIADLSMRHIVSPRASINGARMLAAGMNRDMVESAIIWKGMGAADKARVQGRLA